MSVRIALPPEYSYAPPVEEKVAEDRRSLRWRLQAMAGRILESEGQRVYVCCRRTTGTHATVCKGQNGAYVAGVQTCGSVWACPVCAAKITEGRRLEVRQAIDGHFPVGDIFMGTFTMPHIFTETCADLKGVVALSWRKMLAGEPWKRTKRHFGIVGTIRALELTHGNNGWHPHIHALFFTKVLDESAEIELRLWLGERWARIIERVAKKMGFKDPKIVNIEKGFTFLRAASAGAAGDYVAKWGTDAEIAKASSKVSRKGGRSPWQLLADALEGDHRARMLFREYGIAMFGARHLTWSKGLRALYVSEPEKTDEELANLDKPFNGDEEVISFSRERFAELVRANVMPAILAAAESAGYAGVIQFLRQWEGGSYDRPDTPTG
jgi:hypothetical protein